MALFGQGRGARAGKGQGLGAGAPVVGERVLGVAGGRWRLVAAPFAAVCILGRVVKALDLSPSGHSPREFEPRRMQRFSWEGGGLPPLKSRSVAGVMVSIVAFQAVDPGSIPGPRIPLLALKHACLA